MKETIETVLSVNDIRVKAYHGWYEAERKVGGIYNVSVNIFYKASTEQDFEDLEKSVNYEHIYDVVIQTMQQEFKLIEHCCKSLFDQLKALRPEFVWEVKLVKENPPIKYVGSTAFKIKG